MIKTYCDSCGKEVLHKCEPMSRSDGKLIVQIFVESKSKDGTFETGQACLDCIVAVVRDGFFVEE